MEKVIKTDANEHFAKVMGRFDVFRKNDQHCDFKVKAGSGEIPVHRGVLAASSDYFNAMLSHDTLENQSGVVEIKEADVECVKKCIDYIYTGEVSIPEGKYEQLMHVAHMFQLRELCDGIADFLEDSLDPKSFFVTKRLANMYNCKKLEEKCDQFALENFEAISEAEEFTNLDENYLSFLIKSEDAIASEASKCKALLKWVKWERKTRQNVFAEMIKGFNLAAIPASYRGYLLEEEELAYGTHETMRLLTRSLLDTFNTKPEPFLNSVSRPTDFVVFDKRSQALQRFDDKERAWTKMQRTNSGMGLMNFSAVVLDDHIFMMENRATFRLKCSDANAAWERIADLLDDHGPWPPAVVLGDCIYVVGGGNVYSKSVEKFDLSLGYWMRVKEKNKTCLGSSTAASGEFIYSIGGQDKYGHYLNSLERFSPNDSNWRYVTPMNHARSYPAAVERNNKIYVLGGRSDGNNVLVVECYDPSSDNWTSLAPMKVARQMATAIALNNMIYVVGGFGQGTDAHSIEAFDFQRNEWKIIATWDDMDVCYRTAVAI